MAFFQYRAADHAGKIVEGVMEADAEQGVVARLHEMGCIPLRIAVPGDRLIAGSQTRLPLFPKRKVNPQQPLAARQFDRRAGFYQGNADSSGGGARR